MIASVPGKDSSREPVQILNWKGRSPVFIICDHASNYIPAEFGTLGLSGEALESHIAWDPGALAVAHIISEALDAALIASTVSRLVVDCNRELGAPDLIVETSAGIAIPGNSRISKAERLQRIELVHTPFHKAIEKLCSERNAAGKPPVLISVHSFTPVYSGKSRPWHIGLIFDRDRRLADLVAKMLTRHKKLVVGMNEPYSPADRVYYTLSRHASAKGYPALMIEIRNDLIATPGTQRKMGRLLSSILAKAVSGLQSYKHSSPVPGKPDKGQDRETGPPSPRSGGH